MPVNPTDTTFKSENPDLSELLAWISKRVKIETNCHAIGRIESFNAQDQTCEVSIVYSKTIYRESPTGGFRKEQVQYPILLDCPIVSMYGGNAGLTFPIAQGDECIVMFNDRDIDNWFSGKNSGTLRTNRLHSLSDGFALVGVRSLNNSLSDYDSERAVFFNEQTKILLGEKIRLENTTTDLLTLVNSLIDTIKTITTTNAVPGSPSAISAASQTQLDLIKAQFEGLLE